MSTEISIKNKEAAGDYNIFVSPQGERKFSGLLSQPNEEGTDGPFLTIEKDY